MNSKHIYTDGGCRDGIGACAFIALSDDLETIIYSDVRVFLGTTNNRMEMMAVLNAIEEFSSEPLAIFSDSGYVVDGYNHPSYLKRWMVNGWITSKRDPVENQDMWNKFIIAGALHIFRLFRIKGHGKDPNPIHCKWNAVVDSMCTKAMNDYIGGKIDNAQLDVGNGC